MSELESSVTPLLSQADAEREFGAGSPLAELVGDFLIDGLRDRIHELERERDEARDWVRRLTAETRVLTCVYCGHAYPPGTPEHGDARLTEHIAVCEKHPLRAAEARVAELELDRYDVWARGYLSALHGESPSDNPFPEPASARGVYLQDAVADAVTRRCDSCVLGGDDSEKPVRASRGHRDTGRICMALH